MDTFKDNSKKIVSLSPNIILKNNEDEKIISYRTFSHLFPMGIGR